MLINGASNIFKTDTKALLGVELQAVVKDLATVEDSYARVAQKYVE